MNKKLSILASMVLVFASFAAFIQSQPTGAKKVKVEKVTICHRDNNVKKPYGPSAIEVSVDSIFKGDDKKVGDEAKGHSEHTGDIAYNEVIAQDMKDNDEKWGDIIPPFDYGDDEHFNGLNWDTKSQAMFANDCQYVNDTEVTPTAVSFVDPTCEADGSYTIPAKEGVEYYVNDEKNPTAAGTYPITEDKEMTVTAKALGGYILKGTISWSHVFTFPTEEECGQTQGATSVTATRPTFIASTCDVLGSYIIPTTTGVKYKIGSKVVAAGTYSSIPNGTTITIDAVPANEDYTLKENTPNQWVYEFEAPTNCEPGKGSVLGATTLANTSGDSTAAGVAVISLVAVLITIIGAIIRSALVRQL